MKEDIKEDSQSLACAKRKVGLPLLEREAQGCRLGVSAAQHIHKEFEKL